ncbi:MAG: Na/Pi cotransporter family protein [Clostridia bacterium]|nr:Na/Pi cotransporter family protein [Clostridia bacterium]
MIDKFIESTVVTIVLTFSGGLGMFLFGMKLMSDNLEKIAGSKLRNMLNLITKNRMLGVLVGTLFTALIQSSSATTVMVVGFVNAGLMNLMQATGVIMGANIGTTITAWLVSVSIPLKELAPFILFIGVIFIFFIQKQRTKTTGMVLVGFGLLFIGMAAMSTAMKPLREIEAFTTMLSTFKNPFLGVLAGAVLTGIIQSSSASMGILIAMAGEGLIDLQSAVFIVLGFNIGTCITAILSVIGANKTAKRAAIIHLLFNIIGSILFIILIEIFPSIITSVESLAASTTIQLAYFHTIFNVSMTILLLPFANFLVFLSKKLITGEDPVREEMKLQYLENHMFATPTVLTAQIGLEVERMAQLARQNIHDSIDAFKNKDKSLVDSVFNREQVIDYLNHEISEYLVKANLLGLSEKDSEYISRLFHVVSDLERIGDHAENIAEFAVSRIERGTKYTDEAMEELSDYSKLIYDIIDNSLIAFKDPDNDLAFDTVISLEEKIDQAEEKLRKRHIKRLKRNECNARAGTIFIDILSNLERVADHSVNIASAIGFDD